MSEQPGLFSDPMGYFREQAERTAAEAGKDKYGKANSPGLFNDILGSITGATNAGTQEYRDLEKQTTLQGKYGSQLSLYKGAEVGLGEDEGSVQERLRTKKEEYDSGQRVKLRQELFNTPEARSERDKDNRRWKLTQDQYTDSRTDVANQMELTRAQMATGDKRYMLEMADRKDERAMDREERRARERKEDLRYNENIERMDRKDRKQSIETLVAGLANLGAAFAF